MRKAAILLILLALLCAGAAGAEEEVIAPQWPVPDYVTWLLEVASGEVGYKETRGGYTKYGEWAGNPYAQWCAEFLDWCVDQVDQQHGTKLLDTVWPLYSASNTGKNWFVRQGRYIVRWGNLENWGYQWLKGEEEFLTTGSYIPQPGDWVFFTWTSDYNTDHVAMVEYCTKDEDGNVTIHVIEGNTPDRVKRATYALTYQRILGYGTVRDVADWTVRSGCAGEKVRHLQVKLARLGYLKESEIDGVCGTATVEAITAFQTAYGLKVTGIANIATQLKLNTEYHESVYNDPLTWRVEPDKEKLTLDGFDDLFASDPWAEEEKQPEATEPPEEEPSVSEETAEKQDSLEGETDPMTEAVPEWVTAEEVPEWAEETVELEED